MKVDKREKYNTWRREWWAKTKQLAGNLTESRIFLPKDTYNWVTQIAVESEERLPIVLGKLVVRLHKFETEHGAKDVGPLSDWAQNAKAVTAPGFIVSQDLIELNHAILNSRFPDDTGATRLRQVGFLAAVISETLNDRKPTGSSIARITDNHPTQISGLAKTLSARGVIEIRPTPSPIQGKTSKTFHLRPDAVDAINEAHIVSTGAPIVM
ncbi:hypothetical protein G6L32_14345 [Agrobacterium tumefaciens]|uniref:hypothetical protein n=1 Tax=Agrobacterium tumefaciens TaxID=358 RepID=UPI001571E856|nr:hypothetical protein [Agrobacterium tumefaciens]